MAGSLPKMTNINIRPLYYRDLEVLENLVSPSSDLDSTDEIENFRQNLQQLKQWYGLLKLLSWFPNPFQHHLKVYIAQALQSFNANNRIRGAIQVSPFNNSRTTWRVEQIWVNNHKPTPELLSDPQGVAFQLLRYCLETVWEARTWVLEVNIHEKNTLALYRQNGFQPLAEMTYWALSPDLLKEFAQNDPDLPNLLPVSNADAQLLYQLDCMSMPPLLRQVFDRHTSDFKTNLLSGLVSKIQQLCGNQEISRGYVFEPQRKAAIGYFELTLCKDGSSSHQASLTVHPAYTWLYPKLLTKMAQITQKYPLQPLELLSADYQHEREEYLEQIGAQRVEHTLLMSRSVWHKLRETKPEGLQLAEMLQGLQPVPRTPIHSRMSWLKWPVAGSEPVYKEKDHLSPKQNPSANVQPVKDANHPENGHHA
jgi:hypothetical protein